jgi:hypothetical protein
MFTTHEITQHKRDEQVSLWFTKNTSQLLPPSGTNGWCQSCVLGTKYIINLEYKSRKYRPALDATCYMQL